MEGAANLTTTKRPPKRLIFDRRYGWVIDEWKDPSQEALAGGRGMFCIVPLAKACFQSLTQSINLVANSTIRTLESPRILSSQVFKTNLNGQLQKDLSFTKHAGSVMFRK